ncbi:MAG: hypothetical protein QXX87_02155 [Candidatus Jordarchaeales archaeon]
MSTWNDKVSKAAFACCRKSMETLRVILHAWLKRGTLREKGVQPISRVVVVAEEGMMAEEAVKELLKETGVNFRKVEGEGGVSMVVDGGGEEFTVEVVRCERDQSARDGLTLVVERPGVADRMEALRVLASELGDLDLKSVAEACEGFTTSDIVKLVQFAASRSIAEGREKVEGGDFMEGVSALRREASVLGETLPDDLSEQLYIMAVSESGEVFSELVHKVNSGERLDRRLEKALARYSFILFDEPEERIIKLARARASYERLRKVFEGGRQS